MTFWDFAVAHPWLATLISLFAISGLTNAFSDLAQAIRRRGK